MRGRGANADIVVALGLLRRVLRSGCDGRMASDEIERPANRTRMAASLIEPIISMKQSAVEAATAIANEAMILLLLLLIRFLCL